MIWHIDAKMDDYQETYYRVDLAKEIAQEIQVV
jgi:hypothetical protein